MAIIPFYGVARPDLFAIERRGMDRPGKVMQASDRLMPHDARVLDIGAGCGFTAEALSRSGRQVVAMEPATGMIDHRRSLLWLQGDAECLPFRANTFKGAYATWAYFFPSLLDISTGLTEVQRVVALGGPIALVQNIGGDAFTALAPHNISEDPHVFATRGFALEVVETAFEFESLAEARRLLTFYFGPSGREGARLRLSYRVGIFVTHAVSSPERCGGGLESSGSSKKDQGVVGA